MVLDADQLSAASSTDDLKGEVGPDGQHGSVRDRVAHYGSLAKQNSQMGQIMKRFSFSQKSKEESPSEGSTPHFCSLRIYHLLKTHILSSRDRKSVV